MMGTSYLRLGFTVLCLFLVGNLLGNVTVKYIKPPDTRQNMLDVYRDKEKLRSSDGGDDSKNSSSPHSLTKPEIYNRKTTSRTTGKYGDVEVKITVKPEPPSASNPPTQDLITPSLKDLVVSNIPPKGEQVGEAEVFVSSAFVDLRFSRHFIRSFLLVKKKNRPKINCILQIDGGTKITIKAELNDIYPDWPPNNVYVATGAYCLLPVGLANPSHVEITVDNEKSGVIMQLIKIDNNSRPKSTKGPRIGACVKSLTGRLPADTLIEWLEFQKLTGIHSFIVHNATLEGQANQVLRFYSKLGVMAVLPFPLYAKVYEHARKSGPLSRADDYSIGQQATLVSIQDCLYRSANVYDFTLLVDLDEFLTPFENEDLVQMVQRAYKDIPAAAALTFNTGWYFNDFDKIAQIQDAGVKGLSMASRRIRTPVGGNQPKSIFHTGRFLAGNWHGVVQLPPDTKTYSSITVPYRKYGYVHHFRGECVLKFYEADCKRYLQEYEVDTVLQRYVTRLSHNVKVAKDRLKL